MIGFKRLLWKFKHNAFLGATWGAWSPAMATLETMDGGPHVVNNEQTTLKQVSKVWYRYDGSLVYRHHFARHLFWYCLCFLSLFGNFSSSSKISRVPSNLDWKNDEIVWQSLRKVKSQCACYHASILLLLLFGSTVVIFLSLVIDLHCSWYVSLPLKFLHGTDLNDRCHMNNNWIPFWRHL